MKEPQCNMCLGQGKVMISCPEERPGCLVVHWGNCTFCDGTGIKPDIRRDESGFPLNV